MLQCTPTQHRNNNKDKITLKQKNLISILISLFETMLIIRFRIDAIICSVWILCPVLRNTAYVMLWILNISRDVLKICSPADCNIGQLWKHWDVGYSLKKKVIVCVLEGCVETPVASSLSLLPACNDVSRMALQHASHHGILSHSWPSDYELKSLKPWTKIHLFAL
jgi:hypothetical protein